MRNSSYNQEYTIRYQSENFNFESNKKYRSQSEEKQKTNIINDEEQINKQKITIE